MLLYALFVRCYVFLIQWKDWKYFVFYQKVPPNYCLILHRSPTPLPIILLYIYTYHINSKFIQLEEIQTILNALSEDMALRMKTSTKVSANSYNRLWVGIFS